MDIGSLFPGRALKRARMQRQIAEELLARKAADLISEGIPTFARDRDEDQWQSLSGSGGREPQDYSETDLADMFATALELSFHPGARGLLDTMESFVIGESMHVVALDEDPVVQDYWDQWTEVSNWDMRSKELFRRYLRDGEVFLRWFSSAAPGGHILPRFVEPVEIADPGNTENWGHHSWGIETDPNDVENVMFYYRTFAYNQGGSLTPQQKWERIPANEIDHFKCLVDSNVKRGRSWLMGVAKYIRMHEQWLDQRWQLNRLRTLFAVVANVKGQGGSSVADLKAKFTDTEGRAVAGEGTPKKMPKNAMLLMSRGVEYDLKSLNLNAADAAEDGRNFQLQIAVGTSLPEYVVRGDSSNSNYSSTMVSESPMVRMFQKYQDLWRNIQKIIYARVIRYGIDNGQVPPTSTKTSEAVADQPEPAVEVVPTSLDCQVEFPPLIHRNIKEETEAFALQRLHGWVSDATCSSKLGYDYEQEKEEIAKADGEDQKKAADADRETW